MRQIGLKTARRNLYRIQQRIDYLTETMSERSERSMSHLIAEKASLEWAVDICRDEVHKMKISTYVRKLTNMLMNELIPMESLYLSGGEFNSHVIITVIYGVDTFNDTTLSSVYTFNYDGTFNGDFYIDDEVLYTSDAIPKFHTYIKLRLGEVIDYEHE